MGSDFGSAADLDPSPEVDPHRFILHNNFCINMINKTRIRGSTPNRPKLYTALSVFIKKNDKKKGNFN